MRRAAQDGTADRPGSKHHKAPTQELANREDRKAEHECTTRQIMASLRTTGFGKPAKAGFPFVVYEVS